MLELVIIVFDFTCHVAAPIINKNTRHKRACWRFSEVLFYRNVAISGKCHQLLIVNDWCTKCLNWQKCDSTSTCDQRFGFSRLRELHSFRSSHTQVTQRAEMCFRNRGVRAAALLQRRRGFKSWLGCTDVVLERSNQLPTSDQLRL